MKGNHGRWGISLRGRWSHSNLTPSFRLSISEPLSISCGPCRQRSTRPNGRPNRGSPRSHCHQLRFGTNRTEQDTHDAQPPNRIRAPRPRSVGLHGGKISPTKYRDRRPSPRLPASFRCCATAYARTRSRRRSSYWCPTGSFTNRARHAMVVGTRPHGSGRI
jgi:hypothetical protein